MARPQSVGPTERELEILQALWRRGPSSVREVHESMLELGRVSFSSVQTMLGVMFEKGLVDREIRKQGYVYVSSVSEAEVERTLLRDLMDRVFKGSAQRLVSRALDVKRVERLELEQIRRLVEEADDARDG